MAIRYLEPAKTKPENVTATSLMPQTTIREALEDVKRGRPPLAGAKVAVTLRIDPAVLAAFQTLGPDWRAKMAEILSQHQDRA